MGYKLTSPAILRRCTVICKGEIYDDCTGRSNQILKKEHLWWLINASNKQYLVAYYSEREKSLKELTLKECFKVKHKLVSIFLLIVLIHIHLFLIDLGYWF